jgi:hypothetical protein
LVEASSASGQAPALQAVSVDAAAEQALSFTGPPALGLIVILLKVQDYVFRVDTTFEEFHNLGPPWLVQCL